MILPHRSEQLTAEAFHSEIRCTENECLETVKAIEFCQTGWLADE